MLYYSQYVYENGEFIGIGNLIEHDTKEVKKKFNERTILHVSRYVNLINLSHGILNTFEKPKIIPNTFEEIIEIFGNGEGENVAISNLASLYGPLGIDDFDRTSDGQYICKKFSFNKQWFMKELKKIERLGKALQKVHGYDRTLKDDNKWENKHLSKKESEAARDEFLESLNDCMCNVRSTITAYSLHNGKIELKTDEYEPLNMFGVIVLFKFRNYKKKIHLIRCSVCGQEKEMKATNSPVCESCKNLKRQRRYEIKKSFQSGFTLEQTLEKHSRIPKDVVTELYNEVKNKI